MFLRYLIKVDEGEIPNIYFLHIQFYQENFIIVYKGVIKVDKGEYLAYMLSIFLCLNVAFCFSRKINYLYIYEVNNFWSQYICDPLDQTSLICFGDISLMLVKEKYLDNILSISVCFCCLVFLGKCH